LKQLQQVLRLPQPQQLLLVTSVQLQTVSILALQMLVLQHLHFPLVQIRFQTALQLLAI